MGSGPTQFVPFRVARKGSAVKQAQFSTAKTAIFLVILGLGLFALYVGEPRPKIRNYLAPKGTSFLVPGRDDVTSTDEPPSRDPHGAQSMAPIHYTVPAGWIEQGPRAVIYKSWAAPAPGGLDAVDVAITPLGPQWGGLLENVNRWRMQIGMEAMTADTLDTVCQYPELPDRPYTLVEFASDRPLTDAGEYARAVVGVFEEPEATWFVKMVGEDEAVLAVKPAYLEFLHSIHFDSHEHAQAPDKTPDPAPAGDLTWQVPEGWQPAPPPAMIKFAYSVDSGDGPAATVTVSAFPGAVGGVTANVNRWRGQLGLEQLSAAEAEAAVETVMLGSRQFQIVDLVSAEPRVEGRYPERTMVAMLDHGGRTWFFKLNGADASVVAARAAFMRMLASVEE